nr:hypothetical protein [Mycobacteroides abscessus]
MVTTPIPEVLTYFRSPRRSQPVWELHLGDDGEFSLRHLRGVRVKGFSRLGSHVLRARKR